MRRMMLVAGAAAALCGCATSPAGLLKSDVEQTVVSGKSSKDFAQCVQSTMIGNNPIANDGEHYWILRLNGYGLPASRWDFYPLPNGGSKAELRAAISINTGDERVENCA